MFFNKNKHKNKKYLALLREKLNKKQKKLVLSLLIIVCFDFFLFPLPTLANEAGNNYEAQAEELVKEEMIGTGAGGQQLLEAESFIKGSKLPKNADIKKVNTGVYQMTAYNSDVSQCDASPCITANGFNVCKHGVEDTVAANFLPFGTKIKIPELFGDRIFIVRDRMNSRYTHRVDIWMLEREDALKFGIKSAKIEVLD